jgi:hypothetical protein
MTFAVMFVFLGFPPATPVLANVHDTEFGSETRITAAARRLAYLLLCRGTA